MHAILLETHEVNKENIVFLRRALILHLPNVLWIRRAFMLVLCYHVILFGVILRCKMEQTYKQTVM